MPTGPRFWRTPVLGRLVRWWRERTFERESRAHQQRSDAKTNQEFSESYKALPVSLVAVVSADLYVGGEIRTLDRHLAGFLPPGRQIHILFEEPVHVRIAQVSTTVGSES